MDIKQIISDSESHMQKALSHLEDELTKVRAGKVTPSILDNIVVDYYGNPTPLNQVANVSAADARTLTIQPWEKKMLDVIERAIHAANLGVNPLNDGNMVKLFMPPLTEERRKEFVKKAHGIAEHARVSVRTLRRDAMEHIKKLKAEHVSEDIIKDGEGKVQTATDKYISLIDKHLAAKEKEIMTV